MPEFPDFVEQLKKLHLKRKGNRPKVAPQKFYPSQIELQTQELIREELGDYAYRLQANAQSGGVQGVYGTLGAVPEGFDLKVQRVAESVANFQTRAFADFSGLVVGERYFPTGGESKEVILSTWSDNFVNLCKSTNEEMRKKVAGVVSDGVLSGRNLKDLTKDIQNTCKDFTRNKAELIATTEIGKLNTAIARNQSETAGIKYYEWSAAMDGRTRESHAVMDGKICKWGDDTGYFKWEVGKDGKRELKRHSRPENAYKGAPGTDFRCRCIALPYVPEFEDDYEAEREKGEQRGASQEHPAEIMPSEQTLALEKQARELERKLAISKKADERHVARTEEERLATLVKWEERERKRRIAEAAEKRHAERNEESIRAELQKRLETRAKARELIKSMDGIYGVETNKLETAIATGNTKNIEKEMKPLEKAKKEIEALGDRIDNPLEVAKKYGLDETKKAIDATQKTINGWGHISLDKKKEKLEFEIKWVEDKKKYKTWKISQDVYKKELQKTEIEIANKNRDDEWASLVERKKLLEKLKPKSKKDTVEFSKYLDKVKFAEKGDKYRDSDFEKFKNSIEDAEKYSLKFAPKPKEPTLANLEGAIKDFEKTPKASKELAKHQKEISERTKHLFENSDFGMDIEGELIEKVISGGFKNTFEVGGGNGYVGSRKKTGLIEPHHSRLKMSHWAFQSKASGLKSDGYKDYNGPQLARSEYEKYGHLLDKDLADSYMNNLTHYGGTQVRFKKENVKCTFTMDDSLCKDYQPSLTSNPSHTSFDDTSWKKLDSALPSLTDEKPSVRRTQGNLRSSYIELQFHGKVTIDDVESIVVRNKPGIIENRCEIKKETADKLVAKGIKVFYMEKGKAVEYKP